jgi:hypothetical protein
MTWLSMVPFSVYVGWIGAPRPEERGQATLSGGSLVGPGGWCPSFSQGGVITPLDGWLECVVEGACRHVS